MQINEDQFFAITDRLEGWELVEFLQVSVEEILANALDNDWINEENLQDVLEHVRFK